MTNNKIKEEPIAYSDGDLFSLSRKNNGLPLNFNIYHGKYTFTKNKSPEKEENKDLFILSQSYDTASKILTKIIDEEKDISDIFLVNKLEIEVLRKRIIIESELLHEISSLFQPESK